MGEDWEEKRTPALGWLKDKVGVKAHFCCFEIPHFWEEDSFFC